MFDGPEAAVLGICVAGPTHRWPGDGLHFDIASSPRQAHELMRLRRFDLVLLPLTLPGEGLWDFVRRTRGTWPLQRWALVASALSEQDRATARMMGAAAIFSTPPDVSGLVSCIKRVRQEAASAVHERARQQSG